MTRRRAPALVVVVALACVGCALVFADRTDQGPSRYLFTWVGDEGREDDDFLARARREQDALSGFRPILPTTVSSRLRSRGLAPRRDRKRLHLHSPGNIDSTFARVASSAPTPPVTFNHHTNANSATTAASETAAADLIVDARQ